MHTCVCGVVDLTENSVSKEICKDQRENDSCDGIMMLERNRKEVKPIYLRQQMSSRNDQYLEKVDTEKGKLERENHKTQEKMAT